MPFDAARRFMAVLAVTATACVPAPPPDGGGPTASGTVDPRIARLLPRLRLLGVENPRERLEAASLVQVKAIGFIVSDSGTDGNTRDRIEAILNQAP